MDSTHAILMRRNRFSETSLIVTWFSAEFGKIKTIAKGALRPKSRFAGSLDLFFECEIQFARSARSEIHTLREVLLQDARHGLRTDHRRVALGAYFVELLELATESDHPSPELYDLFRRALHYLDVNPPSNRALVHFESELTRLLGIQNPEQTPTAAFLRVYHRLPASRQGLIQTLKE